MDFFIIAIILEVLGQINPDPMEGDFPPKGDEPEREREVQVQDDGFTANDDVVTKLIFPIPGNDYGFIFFEVTFGGDSDQSYRDFPG